MAAGRFRVALILGLLLIAALGAGACTGDEDGEGGAANDAHDESGDHEHTTTEVSATLNEWSITIEPDRAAHGAVLFRTANEGERPHELVVTRSDAPVDELPLSEGRVNEDEVEVVSRTSELPPGESEELSVELDAGSYILICNIPGHYERGIRTAFTVE